MEICQVLDLKLCDWDWEDLPVTIGRDNIVDPELLADFLNT